MKGRLPDINNDSVIQHPNYGEGQQAAEKNEDAHREAADKLKPKKMNRQESAIWNRVAFELSKANRLKALYVDIIQQYCVVKARLDKLRKELDDEEWFYITSGRYGNQHKSKPGVAQLNDDFRKFIQLTAHLGLSPATELRFTGKQGDLFEDNPFDAI